MRILVADDHDVVRKGVCSLLSVREDFIVCAEAADGQQAIDQAFRLKPDLIIMDVSMPKLDGLSAAKKIHEVLPDLPILILSMHQGAEIIRKSEMAGRAALLPSPMLAESYWKH